MLTSKQRAYLRSVANDMETILIIGKNSVTDEIKNQARLALESRELIKGKVLETAGISARQVAQEISQSINCDVVQVIGTKFILFKANKRNPKIILP